MNVASSIAGDRPGAAVAAAERLGLRCGIGVLVSGCSQRGQRSGPPVLTFALASEGHDPAEGWKPGRRPSERSGGVGGRPLMGYRLPCRVCRRRERVCTATCRNLAIGACASPTSATSPPAFDGQPGTKPVPSLFSASHDQNRRGDYTEALGLSPVRATEKCPLPGDDSGPPDP